MELKIYNQAGELKLTVSASSSSTWNMELMKENAISVSFIHPVFVLLDVNDYVTIEGVKFSINKEYKPRQKSTLEYTYNVKFYGPEHDAERVMYLNLTDGQYDVQFSLDGSPREHLKKWVDNMNRIYGREVWSMGDVVVAPNQTIEYNNLNCWDALASIAEAFETEWWADGFTMNLSRCERGERVSLGYMQGLTSLTQTENSDDVKFFTRLIPLGSTKNIDRSRYGYTRLQLPDKSTYVDRNTHYGLYEYVEEAAFAEIFPHYTGTVSSVRTEEKTGEDGKKFTVYYFKDSGMTFDPCENEIGGLVKQLSFQTGDLGGRDFDANYNSTTKEWEIVNIYPDEEIQIPGSNLIPRIGDTYIPWNFRMPTEYETQAEQDYKAAVDDYLKKFSEDISKYGGDTDYIYIDKNKVPLMLGQNVRLMSDEYFGTVGYRDSRMTKVVRKLDNLSVATIECTNQVGKGWKTQVDSSISQLKYVVGKKEETVLDVMKSWDGREINDYRVLSGLRTLKEIAIRALSRLKDDEAAGLITFLKGLSVGRKGHGISVSDSGIVTGIFDELKNIFTLVSPDFVSGDLGAGFILKYDPETGRSYLEVDEMLVRKVAYFVELVIKQLRYVGGEIILTTASMKCTKVEELPACYRCYFEQDDGTKSIKQEFCAGDQARAQTFNIKEGTSHNVSNKYYWRLVTDVGDDYIDLSKTDCDAGSGAPEAGDDIVQLGNRTDAARQNAIILSTVGDDAPSIKQYKGINSYVLAGKEVTIISPSLNKLVGEFISQATGKNYDTLINDVQVEVGLIKEQADKEYTIWFFEYTPTLTNIPASDWNTDELKALHERDMFYNRDSGLAYRFVKSGSTWEWADITDQQTVKALENAAKAQDTADGKRRVFVAQPTKKDVYDVGDMWVNATYGSLYDNDSLVCKTAKAAGEDFSILHWKPASNATTAYIKNLGDSILLQVSDSMDEMSGLITQNQESTNEAIREAEEAISKTASAALDAMAKAQEGVDGASSAMNKALEAFNKAGTAQDSADEANGEIVKNAVAIQVTDKKITALAAKVTFDASGNITNINKSGLVTTDDMNSLITEKFTFDASGNITNISTAGLVTEDGFAGLFATRMTAEGLVKKADISTFITEDDAGELISNAVISADQIRFNGNIVANDTLVVDKKGNLTLNNITANNGRFNGELVGVSGTFKTLSMFNEPTEMSLGSQGLFFKSNGPSISLRSTGFHYSLTYIASPLHFMCGNAGIESEGSLLVVMQGIPSKNELSNYSIHRNFIYEDNGFLKIGNIDRKSTIYGTES